MQFLSLLYKNMTLWRRGYIGTACEFCTPVVFAIALLLLGSLKTVTNNDGKSYLDNSYHFYPNSTARALLKAMLSSKNKQHQVGDLRSVFKTRLTTQREIYTLFLWLITQELI